MSPLSPLWLRQHTLHLKVRLWLWPALTTSKRLRIEQIWCKSRLTENIKHTIYKTTPYLRKDSAQVKPVFSRQALLRTGILGGFKLRRVSMAAFLSKNPSTTSASCSKRTFLLVSIHASFSLSLLSINSWRCSEIFLLLSSSAEFMIFVTLSALALISAI